MLTAVFALSALASAVEGQRVHGEVRRDLDGSPVAGAVVELRAEGAVLTALSRADGRFVLTVVEGTQYAVVVRRIGFRPFTGTWTASSSSPLLLTVSEVPVPLPSIRVRESARCGIRPDVGLPAGLLWDEARTAMLAASLTMADATWHFESLLSSRLFDLRTPVQLLDSSVERWVTAGQFPWTSEDPSLLRSSGYVRVDSAGMRLTAPDLNVLLSDDFRDSHCLRMVTGRAVRAGFVGLHFAPTGHGRRAEIEGELWFDADSRELRSLEFRYVNLPYRAAANSAGGEVSFERLADGAWILPTWRIRAPVPERSLRLDSAPREAGSAVDVQMRRSGEVRASTLARETGGALLEMRGGADSSEVLWTRPQSKLELQFVTRAAGGVVPVPGVVIGLTGSALQRVSNDSGIVRFEGLVPNAYVTSRSTALHDALGLPPEREVFTLVDGEPVTTRVVTLPSDVEMVATVCRHGSEKVVLLGSVLENGEAVRGGEIRVMTAASPGSGSTITRALTSAIRANGRFTLCGAPVGSELHLLVRVGDVVSTHRVEIPANTRFHTFDIVR